MFKCEKCNKEFKSNRNLELHKNKKIQCNRIIKCEICNKIFKTKQILTRHLNKMNKCIKEDLEQKVKDLEIKITELKLEISELKGKKLKEQQNKQTFINNKDNKIGIIYIYYLQYFTNFKIFIKLVILKIL